MSAATFAVSSSAITSPPTSPTTTACAIPDALQQFLHKVDGWALENKRKAAWDSLKFWSFKVPAILGAGACGFRAFFNREAGLPIAILSGIVVICVVLDGTLRPGKHRNVHLRAFEALQRTCGRTLRTRGKSPAYGATHQVQRSLRSWKTAGSSGEE